MLLVHKAISSPTAFDAALRELAAAYALRKQGNAVEALLTGTLNAVQRTGQSLVGAEATRRGVQG